MVYGQMNDLPGNRLRVALTGLTIAESFRDEGRDVLFFVDNIYRYTWPVPKCPPAGPYAFRRGLPADAGREMGRLQGASPPPRSARSPPSGPCTCLPTTSTDPSPATAFAHLDSTVVLSRDIAALGIYPAVDPLDSTSRQLDPMWWARSTTRCPPGAGHAAALQRNCATSSRFWVWTSCAGETSGGGPRLKINVSCRSPSTWPRCSRARPASMCPVRDHSWLQDDCGRECDHLRQAFYMVGTIGKPSGRPRSWRDVKLSVER